MTRTTYYLMDDYCKYIYYGAAKSGNLDLFQQLKNQGYPFNRKSCQIAAEFGHLNIIQWIVQEIQVWKEEAQETYEEWLEQIICVGAAKNGHLHILKAMPQEVWMGYAFKSALSNGQIEILNWLEDKGHIDADVDALDYSAESHDSILWLTDKFNLQWRWNSKVMCKAAKAGDLNVIKFLRGKNCSWNASVCAAAAENGHFDVLKYLHENGCPWNSTTMDYAAHHGDLQVVQWLIENKCPYNTISLMEFAVKGGNLALIKWIQSKLKISFQEESTLCTTAILHKHWNVLRWLLDSGCEPDEETSAETKEQLYSSYYMFCKW